MLKSRDKSRTHVCTTLSIERKARQSRPISWMGELRPVWRRDLLKPGLCGQETLLTESGGGGARCWARPSRAFSTPTSAFGGRPHPSSSADGSWERCSDRRTGAKSRSQTEPPDPPACRPTSGSKMTGWKLHPANDECPIPRCPKPW